VTLRTRTSARLLAAALALPVIALAALPAAADPIGPPTPRPLSGVGSDTTDRVLNGLAEAILVDGQKVLGSYDSIGPAFTAKAPLPSGATTCDYAANNTTPTAANAAGVRANGSSAGRARFLETLTPGDPRVGCLDFFRSSSLNLTAAPVKLTYVPFAVDGLTYAVRRDSVISRTLSQADLKAIYQCAPSTTSTFEPLLPQSGSGTRGSWLSFLGLTEENKGACVKDTFTDPGSNQARPVQEHDGRALVGKRMIVPFSTAQWAAQSVGTIEDSRADTVLGGIDGTTPLAVNLGAIGTRTVFNGLATSRVGSTAPADTLLNRVFVGPQSEICKQTAVIGRFGFAPAPDCGSTNRVTQ
jgi:ABC-type phosphate transport system substrate-binding protein